MIENPENSLNWSISLARYGMAAGALGVAGGTVQAAEQPFAPVGGLPIAVNDTTTSVDIDIDGDVINDFRVFRETFYGGGFSIAALNAGDSGNRIRAYSANSNRIGFRVFVQRQDSGEIASESGYGANPDLYVTGDASVGGSGASIDMAGGEGPCCGGINLEFTPFRDKPGFISLVLKADSGTAGVTPLQPRIAFLEVVVSPDGSELQILSGAFQDDDSLNEMVLPAVTPPPAAKGLAELALGTH